MCGRTIRVPQIDGTVVPLPKPKMNHGDSGLARALDALASLEGTSAAVAEIETQPAKPVAIVLAPAPAVEPVPMPIPLPSEPVVHSHPDGTSRTANAKTAERSVADPLRELSEMQSPAITRLRRPRPERRRLLLTSAICGLLGITGGFILGRVTSSRNSVAAAAPTEANTATLTPATQPATMTPEQGGVLQPVVAGELKLAIEGRVTYVTTTGESKPDAGARILVLPARRSGTTKLNVISFRAGANSSDLKLAQASIRSLGGDFTLAGTDGHYEVRLPATGQYQLWIVSKYQGRDPESQPATAELAALQNWFDMPRSFVGQTQTTTTDIQFTGDRSSIRDHVFPRAE